MRWERGLSMRGGNAPCGCEEMHHVGVEVENPALAGGWALAAGLAWKWLRWEGHGRGGGSLWNGVPGPPACVVGPGCAEGIVREQ